MSQTLHRWYLVSNKPHDSNPCENVLPADRLLGNIVAVGGGLRVVRLTKVTHEYVHIRTERNSYGISTGSPQIMEYYVHIHTERNSYGISIGSPQIMDKKVLSEMYIII